MEALILLVILWLLLRGRPGGALQLSDLAIEPRQPLLNESVTISCKATNTGSATLGIWGPTGEPLYVNIMVDGEVVGSQEIQLEPGDFMVVQAFVFATEVGKHQVEMDGLKGEFEVVETKVFQVSGACHPPLWPPPPDYDPTHPYRDCKVTVTNVSGSAQSYIIDLKQAGRTIRTEKGTLQPGQPYELTYREEYMKSVQVWLNGQKVFGW